MFVSPADESVPRADLWRDVSPAEHDTVVTTDAVDRSSFSWMYMDLVGYIRSLFGDPKFFHEFIKSRPTDAEIRGCGGDST